MDNAYKAITQVEALRQAADLLEHSHSATLEREKDGHYQQALLLVAQVFDTLMGVEHFVAMAEAKIRYRRTRV